MYKKLLLILITALLLSACQRVNDVKVEQSMAPSFTPTPVVTESPEDVSLGEVTFDTVDIKKENSDYNMSIVITYPLVKGLVNQETSHRINDTIYQFVLSQQEEFESWAKADYDHLPKDMQAWPHSLDLFYEIKSIEETYISLTMTKYYYTGGAHPNNETKGFTFSLKTGKEVVFTELFKDGYDYVTSINQEIFSKQKEFRGPNDEYQYIIEEFEGIEDNPKFYIQNDAVVLFYNPYDIAAYAVGYLEYEISGKIPIILP